MIIVTGSIVTDANNRAAIEAECIAHSRRSRAEPGCLSHHCLYDIERHDRIVFIENWTDAQALLAHFSVPASGKFVQAVSMLSNEKPEMQIYTAQETRAAALTAT